MEERLKVYQVTCGKAKLIELIPETKRVINFLEQGKCNPAYDIAFAYTPTDETRAKVVFYDDKYFVMRDIQQIEVDGVVDPTRLSLDELRDFATKAGKLVGLTRGTVLLYWD